MLYYQQKILWDIEPFGSPRSRVAIRVNSSSQEQNKRGNKQNLASMILISFRLIKAVRARNNCFQTEEVDQINCHNAKKLMALR
jgi:hypothetical protein